MRQMLHKSVVASCKILFRRFLGTYAIHSDDSPLAGIELNPERTKYELETVTTP